MGVLPYLQEALGHTTLQIGTTCSNLCNVALLFCLLLFPVSPLN